MENDTRNKSNKNNNAKKSSSTSTIVLLVVFFIGLCILLYPSLSDFWNEKRQTQAIMNYDDLIVNLTPEDYSEHFRRADEYNSSLKRISSPFVGHGKLEEEYYSTLDINGDGMMGYITIESIDVQLPVYHGTSDRVLNSAVGHVEGSSLPVGGEGTHCVLSAHRGLPSAKLFTNLDKLVEGDIFTIRILDRTFTYQIDQILVVLPEKIDDLYVVEGEDYCTLVTCTPYGINTHRLLVRGRRIENLEDKTIYITTDALQIDTLIVTPIVAAPMLVALIIAFSVKDRRDSRAHRLAKKNKAPRE